MKLLNDGFEVQSKVHHWGVVRTFAPDVKATHCVHVCDRERCLVPVNSRRTPFCTEIEINRNIHTYLQLRLSMGHPANNRDLILWTKNNKKLAAYGRIHHATPLHHSHVSAHQSNSH
eukprot:3194122-Pleurochrysis_carterae.AAC.2